VCAGGAGGGGAGGGPQALPVGPTDPNQQDAVRGTPSGPPVRHSSGCAPPCPVSPGVITPSHTRRFELAAGRAPRQLQARPHGCSRTLPTGRRAGGTAPANIQPRLPCHCQSTRLARLTSWSRSQSRSQLAAGDRRGNAKPCPCRAAGAQPVSTGGASGWARQGWNCCLLRQRAGGCCLLSAASVRRRRRRGMAQRLRAAARHQLLLAAGRLGDGPASGQLGQRSQRREEKFLCGAGVAADAKPLPILARLHSRTRQPHRASPTAYPGKPVEAELLSCRWQLKLLKACNHCHLGTTWHRGQACKQLAALRPDSHAPCMPHHPRAACCPCQTGSKHAAARLDAAVKQWRLRFNRLFPKASPGQPIPIPASLH
jgi:hypothetical protein